MKKVSLIAALALVLMLGLVVGQQGEGGPPQPTPEQMEAMAKRAAQLGLPEGTIQLTPCVPGMGEHWANPADMPLGPIYGVMGDKVTFVEIMPSQEAFANGEQWLEVLKPLDGYAIDHVDFEFQPQGHEGYEVPHYDIHAYFVTHEEHEGFCPGAAAH